MNDPARLVDLEVIFTRVLNLIVSFAVLAVFIMLIIGGFKYLTAGGDAKAVDSARNTLTYAIFGVFGLVLVWLLLKLIETITGVNVTTFKIIP